MGAIFMGCNLVFGLPLSMDRFFLVDENTLAGKSESYYEDVLVVLASALAGSFLLRTIVEKSRKCLDFSVTLYLVHFGACMLYSRFVMPSLGWWIVHFVALVITVVLGTSICFL